MNRVFLRRDGHVLLMTVMVLAICVVLVSGVSRHGMQIARTAASERQQAQEKWAMASCNRFAMMNYQRLLNDASGNPTASTSGVVRLGKIDVQFELNDESAKLDINTVAKFVSRQELKTVVRRLLPANVLKIQPTPIQVNDEGMRMDVYESWGQLLQSEGKLSPTDLYNATRKISCWGRQINYKTADVDVIKSGVKAAAGSVVAERITREIESNRDSSISELLTNICLLYTSPSPRDATLSRMPSSA